MLGLTLLVAGIGAADSVNPSTVLPALYLGATARARGLQSFTVGVFMVYLSGGLVLVLGPGPALIGALRHVGPQVEHLIEAGASVTLACLAVATWRARPAPDHEHGAPRELGPRPAFALGAGIAAVELPTALMYFGAISAILVSHVGVVARISLVIAYNALFVMPLLILIGARVWMGERVQGRVARLHGRLRRQARRILAAVFAAAAVALAATAASGLLLGG